jgi:hypothetical protein
LSSIQRSRIEDIGNRSEQDRPGDAQGVRRGLATESAIDLERLASDAQHDHARLATPFYRNVELAGQSVQFALGGLQRLLKGNGSRHSNPALRRDSLRHSTPCKRQKGARLARESEMGAFVLAGRRSAGASNSNWQEKR